MAGESNSTMKIKLLITLLAILTIQLINAQNNTSKVLKPVLLDKSILSGVGFDKVDLDDETEKAFYKKNLYEGEELTIAMISSQSWNNKFVNFWFDEFIFLFHGETIIKPKGGQTQLFLTGDAFFTAKGYTGEWEVKAGDNLNYELSVISTERADSTIVSPDLKHKLFSRSKLSGAHIKFDENGTYSEILKKGIELTVKLKAEKPVNRVISEPTKEVLIQLISGQISITDSGNVTQTFYTGDFFVIPSGFTGKWNSDGHGLIKYLSVETTESN